MTANTPLVFAAKQRELRAVKVLVQHGASVGRHLKRKATALHHAACVSDNVPVLRFLAEAVSQEIGGIVAEAEPGSPLHWACHSNCVINVAFCLDELGVPVEAPCYWGSALFAAASLQHHDALRFLLERGADKRSSRANDGSTLVSQVMPL